MKAYICDRCGKTYTDNNKVATSGKIQGSYICGIWLNAKFDRIDKSVDLCDDCIVDLFQFLNNETVYKSEEVNQA